MKTRAPKTILYVEDEENDAVLMELAFQRAGVTHPLHVVNDGQQALDFLHRVLSLPNVQDATGGALPCLILLDLNLPQMGGLEILEHIRREPRLAGVPVVIFTSSAQNHDLDRARELGASDYLVKPTSLPEFMEVAEALKHWCAP